MLELAIADGQVPADCTDTSAALRIRTTAGMEAARGLPSDATRWRCGGAASKGRSCCDSGWSTTTEGGTHMVTFAGKQKICGRAIIRCV